MFIAKHLKKQGFKLLFPRTSMRQAYNFISIKPNKKLFSTQKPEPQANPDNDEWLLSGEAFHKFYDLMHENTQDSLEKAAELMAKLQIKYQQNYQMQKELQEKFEGYPPEVRTIVEKIQNFQNNINHKNQQLKGLDSLKQKQLKDCKDFSISPIAKEMLQISDVLSKCKKLSLAHDKVPDSETNKSIQKAYKQLKAIFQKHEIVEFDPAGQSFDPNLQESLVIVATKDVSARGKVAHTIRTGFTIKGRLLRSAHVAVYG